MKVFILGGQSNGVGGAAVPNIPAAFASYANAYDLAYAREHNCPKDFLGGACDLSTGWLTQVTPHGPTSATGSSFGAEMTFGRRLLERFGSDIALIVHATDGSRFNDHWEPDTANSLFQYMETFVDARMAELVAGSRIAGMLWVHGEGDSASDIYARAYDDELAWFIIRLRQKYGHFHVVLNQIFPGDVLPSPAITRDRQSRVEQYLQGVTVVSTSDLALRDDVQHYDPLSFFKIGYRAANAFPGGVVAASWPGFDQVAVATDGPLAWYRPASNAEMALIGEQDMDSIWLLQDAAGGAVDAVGGENLAEAGGGAHDYQQAEDGWDSLFLGSNADGDVCSWRLAAGHGPNPSADDVWWDGETLIDDYPAANRTLFMAGPNLYIQLLTTGLLRLYVNGTFYSGAEDHVAGPAWGSGQAITAGDRRRSHGRIFVATSTGTTGATAPKGNGSDDDGGVTWDYVGPAVFRWALQYLRSTGEARLWTFYEAIEGVYDAGCTDGTKGLGQVSGAATALYRAGRLACVGGAGAARDIFVWFTNMNSPLPYADPR